MAAISGQLLRGFCMLGAVEQVRNPAAINPRFLQAIDQLLIAGIKLGPNKKHEAINKILNSPWCMYLIFYKAGAIAGCVIWRRIWQPTWRYGGNEVAADDSGSRTANECVRRAGKSGFSVPAACPHPITCAGSGSD